MSVPRPAVRARLDAAHGPVILVTAPAGYGKTTAVADWSRIQAAHRPVAWCALGPEARHADDLWRTVHDALTAGGTVPGSGAAQPEPATAHPAVVVPRGEACGRGCGSVECVRAGADQIVDALARAVRGGGRTAAGDGPLLVVDGLLPQHPPALRTALAELARRLPAGARMVITARGAVPELPAGFRLALDERADGTAPEDIDGSCPGLRAYLRGEITDRLPAADLDVLDLCARVPRLGPAAAEELLGEAGRGAVRRLEDAGAFLGAGTVRQGDPVGDAVHPLLRQALVAEARTLGARTGGPSVAAVCSVLERDGEIAAAVDCAVAARDTATAAALLERHSDWLLRTGRTEQVHRWLAALTGRPGPDVPGRDAVLSPQLAGELAWNIALRGAPDEADAWAAQVPPSAPLVVRMRAACIRVFAARAVGDARRALELVPEARRLAVLATENGHREDGIGEQISLGVQRTAALAQLDRDAEAARAADGVLGLLQDSDHPAGAVRLYGMRAQLAARAGRLREAEADCERGERLVERHGLAAFPGRGELLLARGLVLYERDDVAQAESVLRAALRISDDPAWPHTVARIRLALAGLLHAQGRTREAERFFDAAARANPHRSHDAALARTVAATRALALLRAGSTGAARPWYREARESGTDTTPVADAVLLDGYAAAAGWAPQLGADQACPDPAGGGEPEGAGPEPARLGPRAEARALLAFARATDAAAGTGQAGPQALRRVAALTRRHGLLRTVLDDIRGLEDHLERAARRYADAPEGVELRKLGRLAAAEHDRAEQPAGALPLRLLTAQERAVAVLLARGSSNEHIAASLFVSVNTVKTHLRHVYRKLDVRSRAEARARIGEVRVNDDFTRGG